jgi:hypothetical protein
MNRFEGDGERRGVDLGMVVIEMAVGAGLSLAL